PSVIIQALEKALTFILDRGEVLINAYLTVAAEAHRQGVTVPQLDRTVGISNLLPREALDLSIDRWSVKFANSRSKGPRQENHLYLMREGAGLHEQLMVLFGACSLVLGVLSAR